MNRFNSVALALSLGLLSGLAVQLPAQTADPTEIDIATPPGNGGDDTRGSGDQFNFEDPTGEPGGNPGGDTRDRSGGNPAAPLDTGPGFDGLNTSERRNRPPQFNDDTARRQSATASRSSDPQTRQIEAEMMRIDLDLRELESDIRSYQGLLETSRGSSESQAIQRALYDYEAQRRALIAQKQKLSTARQRVSGGRNGPGAPDPSFTANTFEEEQRRRLKDGMDGNPLSPESIVGNTARDAVRARDVTRDNEIQKFIEQLQDPDLQEKVSQLNDAARMDPSLQKPFDDLLESIRKAGGKNAKLTDVQDAVKKMEDETKRKGLESNQLVTLFMAKAGRDAIPAEDYNKYVKVIADFDQKNAKAGKEFSPEVKKALQKAREDYVAYQMAEKKFLMAQTNAGLREQAELKFQTHLQSLKSFLKLLDQVTGGGSNPNGIYKSGPAAPTDAPVLARRNATGDLPVPDAPAATSSTAAGPAAPADTTATSSEPSAAAKANPDLLGKVATALKSFDEGVDTKLKEVERRVEKAWTADRHWYSGYFWTTDPREAELTVLSKSYFSWDSSDRTGNVFNIWPTQLAQIYADAATGGIDVDKEPSLRAATTKAREAVLGTMLVAKQLQGYDGHLKTVEDADLGDALKKLNVVRDPSPTHFDLKEFRDSIAKDAPTIRLKVENLWTNQQLSDARALLAAAQKKDFADQSKLEDLKVQFHWFQQRMARGYQSGANGYGYWMSVTDSNVYRLVEIVNNYLDKKAWFEAKVALDELR
ncbi:MAG: hypothetical protein HY303_03175 [Candidatus Wallbacteria bacterium]|nr:hypothetical protein [Candidatus Wallbacteria bacterium]